MERLDKVLAATGRWSRSQAKALVKGGRVLVDGRPAQRAEDKIGEEAVITVDGHPIRTARTVWLMLHKPQGVVSSTEDPRERTVLSLLPPELRRIGLFPVGRLDKDTEGLLLLTNDGDLAHRILSPRHGVWKRYYAGHEGTAGPADVRAFEAGLVLADGLHCLPAKLTPLGPGRSVVEVQEGKYHQVRRMLASRGLPVTYLRREAEGRLTLGDLPLGQTKELNIVEAEQLLLNIL